MSDYAEKMKVVRAQWNTLGCASVSVQVPVGVSRTLVCVGNLITGDHLIRLVDTTNDQTIIDVMAGRLRSKLVPLEELYLLKERNDQSTDLMKQADVLEGLITDCIQIDRDRMLAKAEGREGDWIFLEAKLYAHGYYTNAFYAYLEVCVNGYGLAPVMNNPVFGVSSRMTEDKPEPLEEAEEVEDELDEEVEAESD